MLYAIICADKPGALEVRKANREAHLAHIKASDGVIVLAGPFLDRWAGCAAHCWFYEGEREGAEAWAAADPYAQAGLFQSVEIRAWKKVVG